MQLHTPLILPLVVPRLDTLLQEAACRRALDWSCSPTLPLEQGIVYIENWGRKADILMRRLLATTSLQEVWCNSEQGATPLDLQAILETARVLDTQDLADQADRIVFWKPITDAAKGNRDPEAFEKWLSKVPRPHDLLAALPLDPFSRLRLPAVLGEIMPRLAGLKVACRQRWRRRSKPGTARLLRRFLG